MWEVNNMASQKILNQVHELNSIAELALSELKKLKADEAQVQVSFSEAHELNIESNHLSLLRTTVDQNISIKSLFNHREAVLQSNQLGSDQVKELAAKSYELAKSSPEDKNKSLPGIVEKKEFLKSTLSADLDWMYLTFEKLLNEVQEKFPKIILEGAVLKHVNSQKVLQNSKGSHFSEAKTYYEGFVMFTAKEGGKSSSFNYTGFVLPDTVVQDKEFNILDFNGLRELFQQASEQIEVKKVSEKFVGDIVITPHCLEDFIHYWTSFVSSERMLKKNSPWQNSQNQKIASDKLTLICEPNYFPIHRAWTDDGLSVQAESIIEAGVLKNYLVNHYAAKKLNLETSRSSGVSYRVKPGQKTLTELIKSTQRGVLLCRYSAGNPAENGDISGVAKNSYYIENGQIQYPLGETMVSGNLLSMIQNIKDLSSEVLNSGSSELPWIKIGGVGVS